MQRIHLCFNLIEFNYEILMRLIALEKQQQQKQQQN